MLRDVDCRHQIDELLANVGDAGRDQQVPSTGKFENCSEDQVRMLKQRDEVLTAWTVLRFKPIADCSFVGSNYPRCSLYCGRPSAKFRPER